MKSRGMPLQGLFDAPNRTSAVELIFCLKRLAEGKAFGRRHEGTEGPAAPEGPLSGLPSRGSLEGTRASSLEKPEKTAPGFCAPPKFTMRAQRASRMADIALSAPHT